MRHRRAAIVALLCACSTKIPTRERSTTPQDLERDAAFQPDPEPFEGGAPFGDASGAPPYDAGCPDALPEAGADCREWQGAFDCPYGELECTCKSTPEADWWSCAPP